MLPFVHEIAVETCEHLFDALLATRHHELFQFAMGVDQHFSSRRFERHAPFGADDGVAEVNAAANAELRAD